MSSTRVWTRRLDMIVRKTRKGDENGDDGGRRCVQSALTHFGSFAPSRGSKTVSWSLGHIRQVTTAEAISKKVSGFADERARLNPSSQIGGIG